MKTRRILAASTAALLAFGATAVIASAADYAASDLAVAKAAKSAATNVKGAISFDKGDNYVVTVLKDYTKDPDDSAHSGATKAGFEDAVKDATLDADFDTDLNVAISAKDAMKLSGWCELTASISTVDEADDDLADVGEDTVLAGLGLEKDNINILKKTKAADIKVINVKVAKDGKVGTTIGKPLTITLANSVKNANVYHVNSDGTVSLIKSDTTVNFDDKYETSFSTSTFSPFIITTAKLKASAASTDDSSAAESSDGTAASTNPETGIALAIAPVVLAAGAVAVVALKKKH